MWHLTAFALYVADIKERLVVKEGGALWRTNICSLSMLMALGR